MTPKGPFKINWTLVTILKALIIALIDLTVSNMLTLHDKNLVQTQKPARKND